MDTGGIIKSSSSFKRKGFPEPGKGRYQYQYVRRRNPISIEEEDATLYASPIAVYDTIPNTSLSVADFEKYALGRLKALRVIERINTTHVDKYTEEWRQAIESEMRKQELYEFLTVLFTWSGTDSDEVRRVREFDNISHFLLRLAFAGTEEQRKWFISLELDMFRLRLKGLTPTELQTFLKDSNFPGELISEKERKEYKSEIEGAFGGNPTLCRSDVYRLQFESALDLVRLRKVFLRRGEAYVPFPELITVITSTYRSHLSSALSMVTKRMHLAVGLDERILQVISDFDRRHTGSDYSNKRSNIAGVAADEIPALSQKSFPLCMKTLYDVVVKDHHLKHFGRLQLGLFLKAVGVPMEEATKFWRGHFTKKPEIDGSRFDKQYLYNIRHMYGHEGKRADYTPYSCLKVINSNVGGGDFHGCPFKHSDQPNLRAKLVDAQIPSNGIKEILDLVEKHHFQIACQKYFEWTHGSMTVDGGVNHPNQYFEESTGVLSGKKTIKAEEKIKTKRVLVMPRGHVPSIPSTPQDQADDSTTPLPLPEEPEDPFAELMDVDEIESDVQEFLSSQNF